MAENMGAVAVPRAARARSLLLRFNGPIHVDCMPAEEAANVQAAVAMDSKVLGADPKSQNC